MKRVITRWSTAGTMLVWCAVSAPAQERPQVQYSISYIAASAVYVDAGREQGVTVGDTLTVVRAGNNIGTIEIIAVSRISSAATIISQQTSFSVGDQVVGTFAQRPPGGPEAKISFDTTVSHRAEEKQIPSGAVVAPENVLTGRIVAQYNAIVAEDSRFNLNQPAMTLRMNVGNLLGTGMNLSVNGRSYYDASNNYAIYGARSGLKSRAYEVSLVKDIPDASWGYGIGRLTSRYVGGMGTFDGLQLYYRSDRFTAGVLGGAQVVDRTLTFSQSESKGSVFLNYHQESDVFHQYDGTIAYGRQMVGSNLDRQFLYVQNFLSLGSEWTAYESSEIELNDIADGRRTSAFRFSNSFVSVDYRPLDWLSTNFGYDAFRTVYLFETMKSIPDSLIDRNLTQRFRAGATMRWASYLTLSATAAYGVRQGGFNDSHILGMALRGYDIGGIDLNGGVRYSNFAGPYSEGYNVALDLDRSFWRDLTVSLRYDYNKYSVAVLRQAYPTHTGSVDIFYRISPSWSTSITGEYVYDQTMDVLRIFAEVGYRF